MRSTATKERTDNTLIADLITNYVASVAQIWLRHGIRPGRAVHPSNPNYRSKFHRFVDLVLTAVSSRGPSVTTAKSLKHS